MASGRPRRRGGETRPCAISRSSASPVVGGGPSSATGRLRSVTTSRSPLSTRRRYLLRFCRRSATPTVVMYMKVAGCGIPSRGRQTPSLPGQAQGSPCRLSPVVAGVLGPGETVWDRRGNTFPPKTPQNTPRKRPRNDQALLVIWSAEHIAIGGDHARIRARADVAQLVEHLHGKEGVRGSSPRVGLPKNRAGKRFSCCPGDSCCSGALSGQVTRVYSRRYGEMSLAPGM